MNLDNGAKLWRETPLIHSSRLSWRLGCDVYLKLENLQPAQSFKSRGISLFAQEVKATHGDHARLIIASGGNAGLAAACAARTLGLRCTVYLPKGASEDMIRRLEEQHSEVIEFGGNYLEASREAARVSAEDPTTSLVPAYDDPLLWTGHGTMIQEIESQMRDKPDAIFCSVGGGGLIARLMEGCRNVGWDDVPLVALETHGSACFYHSIACNDVWKAKKNLPVDAWVSFDEENNVRIAHVPIHSKASSLGATSPSTRVVRTALGRSGRLVNATIPDEMAMGVTRSFANDHKMLVELACSTTLAPAYHPTLFRRLLDFGDSSEKSGSYRQAVIFIVCGGVKISFEEPFYRSLQVEEASRSADHVWEVFCNGKRWEFESQCAEA